jgi:hypothetical protein
VYAAHRHNIAENILGIKSVFLRNERADFVENVAFARRDKDVHTVRAFVFPDRVNGVESFGEELCNLRVDVVYLCAIIT